jgi:hypothetical protein
MARVTVECPNCAWEGEVDESLVGRKLKCTKCGTSFIAEAGTEYGVEGQPRTPASGALPRDQAAADEGEDDDKKSWLEAWPEE